MRFRTRAGPWGLTLLLACSGGGETEERGATQPPAAVAAHSAVFVKAEPARDSVLRYPPRTLRVYLRAAPDLSKSSLALFGPSGEIALRRFHTMDADDLMIEIAETPLPPGEYRVQWTATVEGDETAHAGSYSFTVAKR